MYMYMYSEFNPLIHAHPSNSFFFEKTALDVALLCFVHVAEYVEHKSILLVQICDLS